MKERKLPASVSRGMSYLLIFLPVALGFAYVRMFGVDVPHYDTWSMVPYFEKFSSGTLTLRDLFMLHNEHRIVFPRIAMLLLGTVTAFDNVAIMNLTQVCLVITLVTILLAFRSSVTANPIFFVAIPFLVFTWGQIWNMLQAFQITLIFAQTFSVLTFYLLYVSGFERFRKIAFPGALLTGTVASFSAALGLLVWPVGFLQILISSVEKTVKGFLAGAWGLVGLAEWIVYFHDYEKPDNMSSHYLSDGFLTSIEYFLTALGASLFREGPAPVAGVLLIGLIAASLLFVYRDRELGKCSFWISLLPFSLLILASTTLARGGSGIEDALNSKYVTFSILAVIGAYAMLVRSALEHRKPVTTISLGILTALIVSSIPVSYAEELNNARIIEKRKEQAAFVLATYRSQPDEVMVRFFRRSPEASRHRASVLETLGYSVFSEPRPGVLPPTLSDLSPARARILYDIETISGVEVSSEDLPVVIPEDESSINVVGWAVDAEARNTAGGVYVVIDGEPIPAFYGMSKEDVAERLGSRTNEYSGFWRAIPIEEIGPGTHELSIIIVTHDGEGYYRPDRKIVFIVE